MLGLLARRVGLSPIVGYLVAGIVVGPFTPWIVVDHDIAEQLAELGIVVMMFGVGLHFRGRADAEHVTLRSRRPARAPS